MTKPPVYSCALIALTFSLVGPSAFAGDTYGRSARVQTSGGAYTVAEREVVRRQENISRAEAAIATADRAMKERDYETAFAQYKLAADLLPEAEATRSLRKEAVYGLCDAGCALAEQRIAEGRYQDAELIAKTVVEERYDPDCSRAITILAHLEDPGYYNKTITPKFRANVEEVKKLFREAEGYYQTGQFNLAYKRYEQILNIDPYNISARKGQERVNLARSNYQVQAYNMTRSQALWEVEKAWERPIRKFGLKGPDTVATHRTDIRGTEYIQNKLNSIIIPRIEFREATVREAIDFLKQKSRELDTKEPDPSRRGVNIVLKLDATPGLPATGGPSDAAGAVPGLETTPAAPAVNPADTRITLSLTNIPLIEALRYITNLSNLKIKIDPYAVAIVPITESTDVLITKEYKVPPNFITAIPAGGAAATGAPADASASRDATGAGQQIAGRANARAFLEANGVTFPAGASANYLASSSRLVVRNTQENLDLIDTLVDAAGSQVPTQVDIEAKFVEITQQNLKELSFDVLIGQGNIPGSDKVFVSGGTSGTGTAPVAGNFPLPFATTGPLVQQPLTAGLRSGSAAITANAIDALLLGQAGAVGTAPAIFGIGSVLTDPTFQVVLRAINQKKGVDLLSAPRVTTRSGQRAVIEIIREFRYPTEFDPPQIPQDFGGGNDNGVGGGGGASLVFPVTPTTPTAFETRNTGVTLEVEPTVGPDGYTIDLNLIPQVVEFEGFINYGSPIRTVNPALLNPVAGGAAALLGTPSSVILTENVINQPIFSTRKVTTSVSIWDGQTVVLGGLMREDIQKVEDKVPILGDIPLLGRAFRSQVDQHLKRNLLIFVTARLINPAGETILQTEEAEEVVEPLGLPQAPMEAPLFKK